MFTDMALHSRYAVTVSAAVAARSRADYSSMEDRRRKSLNHERGKRGHTSLSRALVYGQLYYMGVNY